MNNAINTLATFPKVREPVLCMDRKEIELQLGRDIAWGSDTNGIFDFHLVKVHRNSFSFINRSIVDDQNRIGTMQADMAKHYPQVNGYILVRYKDKVLRYTREQSDEARLVGADSIGFGGHADAHNCVKRDFSTNKHTPFVGTNYSAMLHMVASAELKEELCVQIDALDSIKALPKIIIDNRPNEKDHAQLAQGQVHVGLLYEYWLEDPSQVQATPEAKNLTWLTVDELKNDPSEYYESWSKILINQYL